MEAAHQQLGNFHEWITSQLTDWLRNYVSLFMYLSWTEFLLFKDFFWLNWNSSLQELCDCVTQVVCWKSILMFLFWFCFCSQCFSSLWGFNRCSMCSRSTFWMYCHSVYLQWSPLSSIVEVFRGLIKSNIPFHTALTCFFPHLFFSCVSLTSLVVMILSAAKNSCMVRWMKQ